MHKLSDPETVNRHILNFKCGLSALTLLWNSWLELNIWHHEFNVWIVDLWLIYFSFQCLYKAAKIRILIKYNKTTRTHLFF